MTCYDAAMLWAQAVNKAGDEKNYRKVSDVIRSNPYKGLAGERSFSKENWGTATNSYMQIQDGKFTLLSLGSKKIENFKTPPWVQK
jgi:ABC-type branched-subunit amino acid transport system substrate-binding protein